MSDLSKPRKLIMELAEKHALFAAVDSMTRSRTPGEIIQNLPDDQRAVLKNLKSSDVQNVRWPLWR